MEEIVRISRIHQFRILPLRIRSLSLAKSLHEVPLMTPATPNQRLVLGDCDYVLLACEKEVYIVHVKKNQGRGSSVIRVTYHVKRVSIQEGFLSL